MIRGSRTSKTAHPSHPPEKSGLTGLLSETKMHLHSRILELMSGADGECKEFVEADDLGKAERSEKGESS